MGASLTTIKNTEKKYEDINIMRCREEIESLKRELEKENFWNIQINDQNITEINSIVKTKNNNAQPLPQLKNNLSMEKFLIPNVSMTKTSNACAHANKEETAAALCWMKGIL
eukprot:798159_1